ncbi:MAG: hypothetical protein LBH20_09365 [Treponema sp.]|jgi:hypothetical protein|nr:hypothetical protein [Treponema sp.]
MKLIADLSKNTLIVDECTFSISNIIRTLRCGSRASYEVILSLHDNMPYDPQAFPKGLWSITGLEWQKEKGFDYNTYGPVKIRTDAWQMVKVWELDKNGDYLRETEKSVEDFGYLLHYSKSSTTLGCIRIASHDDAEMIAGIIQRAFDNSEKVELEVL